jgi:hypothetical protein
MKRNIVVIALVLTVLFFGLAYCHKADARQVITEDDIVSAEKVLKVDRPVKKVAAVVGGIGGGFIGYQAAVAMALPPAGVVQAVLINGFIGAVYLYGAASAGQEMGIHSQAKKILADRGVTEAAVRQMFDDAKRQVASTVKEVNKEGTKAFNSVSNQADKAVKEVKKAVK